MTTLSIASSLVGKDTGTTSVGAPVSTPAKNADKGTTPVGALGPQSSSSSVAKESETSKLPVIEKRSVKVKEGDWICDYCIQFRQAHVYRCDCGQSSYTAFTADEWTDPSSLVPVASYFDTIPIPPAGKESGTTSVGAPVSPPAIDTEMSDDENVVPFKVLETEAERNERIEHEFVLRLCDKFQTKFNPRTGKPELFGWPPAGAVAIPFDNSDAAYHKCRAKWISYQLQYHIRHQCHLGFVDENMLVPITNLRRLLTRKNSDEWYDSEYDKYRSQRISHDDRDIVNSLIPGDKTRWVLGGGAHADPDTLVHNPNFREAWQPDVEWVNERVGIQKLTVKDSTTSVGASRDAQADRSILWRVDIQYLPLFYPREGISSWKWLLLGLMCASIGCAQGWSRRLPSYIRIKEQNEKLLLELRFVNRQWHQLPTLLFHWTNLAKGLKMLANKLLCGGPNRKRTEAYFSVLAPKSTITKFDDDLLQMFTLILVCYKYIGDCYAVIHAQIARLRGATFAQRSSGACATSSDIRGVDIVALLGWNSWNQCYKVFWLNPYYPKIQFDPYNLDQPLYFLCDEDAAGIWDVKVSWSQQQAQACLTGSAGELPIANSTIIPPWTKICKACSQEYFNGSKSCHLCGTAIGRDSEDDDKQTASDLLAEHGFARVETENRSFEDRGQRGIRTNAERTARGEVGSRGHAANVRQQCYKCIDDSTGKPFKAPYPESLKYKKNPADRRDPESTYESLMHCWENSPVKYEKLSARKLMMYKYKINSEEEMTMEFLEEQNALIEDRTNKNPKTVAQREEVFNFDTAHPKQDSSALSKVDYWKTRHYASAYDERTFAHVQSGHQKGTAPAGAKSGKGSASRPSQSSNMGATSSGSNRPGVSSSSAYIPDQQRASQGTAPAGASDQARPCQYRDWRESRDSQRSSQQSQRPAAIGSQTADPWYHGPPANKGKGSGQAYTSYSGKGRSWGSSSWSGGGWWDGYGDR